jgi:23S rRNA (adenine2503-C2)-methyltransferase
VSLSTCGLVPKIYELAELKLGLTLCISLHSSDNSSRSEIMPVNRTYNIEALIEACKHYISATGRRITFEYSLVGGVNDTMEDAKELIALVKPLCCHVNLIPVNPIKERDFVQSDTGHVQAFKNILEKNKINCTIRREMGRDIDGACGQLRRRHIT